MAAFISSKHKALIAELETAGYVDCEDLADWWVGIWISLSTFERAQLIKLGGGDDHKLQAELEALQDAR